MVLFLDDHDIARLVTMDEALVSVERALAAQGRGHAANAPRRRLPLGDAALNVLGGALALTEDGAVRAPHEGWMGAKISVSAGGGARKKSWFTLFDGTGTLRALLESNRLGLLRTGAASGVSAGLLAASDAEVLGCLGAGYQAWGQIEAIARVRPIGHVLLWNRTRDRAHALARRVTERLGLSCEVTPRAVDAVAGSRIVVTVTATTEPILHGAEVRPGTHVVLAGANTPARREADAALFARADAVFVDDLPQAREVSGDLRMAAAEGTLDWSRVEPLGALVVSDAQPPTGTTVFCSQGVGAWDVALAHEAYHRALTRGAGTQLPITGEPLDDRP
ncbi:ornithine cyclodeaminase family protein [Streptomyces sp. NBRC 109706]|uniref:ornithine cyclodeaminase family protein n=1 Tax=Streptomyces sp. NBRC 109706 TaxID=1550035 RepID=UPI0007848A77|nr:ornithine cyclodeaminase family protein [Streptomyces sp. NBRC 109706]